MTLRESEGNVVPPPVIFLVFLLAGVGLDRRWPLPFIPESLRYPFGIPIIALSFVLFGLVLREFFRARTSVDHRKPTTSVISTGPFRFSRNPIYVSMAMLCIGVALVTNMGWILVMTAPAIVLVHFLVVVKEEAFLEERFGDEYRRYKASVRRWV